jgi:outer membrane protein assembly factor BamB
MANNLLNTPFYIKFFARFLYKIQILVVISLLASCSGSKDNTEPPAPLVEFTPTLTVKTLWTANAGGGTQKSYLKLAPVFYNERLFTASPTGKVRAFNFRNGKQIWEQKINLPISGGPGAGQGLIVVGSHKGDVVALSETDGREQWRTQVSSEVLVAPGISQGVVVVRTIDGKLFGLARQNGERLWLYEGSRVPLLTLRGMSTPVVKMDVVLVGFDNGKIALLDLHKGKVIWEYVVGVPRGRTDLERMVDIDADPLFIKDMIYVTSYQGRTMAINLGQGGKLLWEKPLSSHAGLGADFDYLYVSDSQSHVWALNRQSGEEWWKQDKLHARHVTAPVSLDDYVIVGDSQGYLHWMRRDNGQFVARQDLGEAAISVHPLVIDGVLIAYNRAGKMVALQPE